MQDNRQTCNVFNYDSPKKTMVECLARDPYCTMSGNKCVPVSDNALAAIGVPRSLEEYRDMLTEITLTQQRYNTLFARLEHNKRINPQVEAAVVNEVGILNITKAKLLAKVPDFVKKFISYAGVAVRFGIKHAPSAWAKLQTAASYLDVALTRLSPQNWVFVKKALVHAGLTFALPALVSTVPFASFTMQFLYKSFTPGLIQKMFNAISGPLVTTVTEHATKSTYEQGIGLGLVLNPLGLAGVAETGIAFALSPVGAAFLMSLTAVGTAMYMTRRVALPKDAYAQAEMRVKIAASA